MFLSSIKDIYVEKEIHSSFWNHYSQRTWYNKLKHSIASAVLRRFSDQYSKNLFTYSLRSFEMPLTLNWYIYIARSYNSLSWFFFCLFEANCCCIDDDSILYRIFPTLQRSCTARKDKLTLDKSIVSSAHPFFKSKNHQLCREHWTI